MSDKCKKCGAAIEFGNYCRNCLMTPVAQETTSKEQTMKNSGGYNFFRFLAILAWLGTVIGAGFGFVILIGGFSTAQSAPQEAVVAALACAVAILPYCIARSFTEIANLIK